MHFVDLSSWSWQGGAGWMVQPLLLLAAAILLAFLAAWLAVRARRSAAKKPPEANAEPQPKVDRVAGLRRRFDALATALRYLSTRREWRYASPWVLLLGERGGGKSSLAASLNDGRREAVLLRERHIPADGADWYFCSGGVIVDPDGELAEAEPESSQGQRWQKLLDAISERRPERALDATVLVVAADSLLTAEVDELQRLAECCYRQLWQAQKNFEFVLPLYVVVTRCDAITGFTAFWRNQPEGVRDTLWGWSNTSLADHEDPEVLAGAVFDETGSALRQLQIDAAGRRDDLEAADDFFLFPQRFAALRPGLTQLLGTLLQSSVHHAGFYFRGVYFCGSVENAGDRPRGVCDEVDFANALFHDKVFAEPGLARPLRQSLWSRNRLIWRVQVALVTGFLMLCTGLAWNSVALAHQMRDVGEAERTVTRVVGQHEMDGECIAYSAVYRLLDQVGQLRVDQAYPFIPASWVDHRVANQTGLWLARHSFQDVVMPSLSCRLAQEARQLASGPAPRSTSATATSSVDDKQAALHDYLDRVIQLQRNLADFDALASDTGSVDEVQQVKAFERLFQSVYQAPLPKSLEHADGAYYRLIANIRYGGRPKVPADFNAIVTKQLRTASKALQDDMFQNIELGGKLLIELQDGRIDVAQGVAELQGWARWLRLHWLGSDSNENLCADVQADLDKGIRVLQRDYGYPAALSDLSRQFEAGMCYGPAMERLAKPSEGRNDAMVNKVGHHHELNHQVAAELLGFDAISKLPYMSVQPHRTFSCQAAVNGWREAPLKEIEGYVRNYQVFALAAKVDMDQAPLYDRLARRQLQVVIADRLVDAESIATPATLVADAEERAAEQSSAFARQRERLAKIATELVQIGDASDSAHLSNCLRDFATDALNRVDALADDSRLYQPAHGDDNSGASPLYILGDTAAVRDYLQRQRDRVAVLANYAEPFVHYLDASPPGGSPGSSAQGVSPAVRWRATLTELNHFQSGKDSGGALGTLEDFFRNTLAPLDYDNCTRMLAKVGPTQSGADLFGTRAHALNDASILRCTNVREADAFDRYSQLANRFNRELAGHYPFADTSARDLDLPVARAFFRDYASERGPLHHAVEGLKGKRWTEIGHFLDQLDAVAGILEPSLAAADAMHPLRLDVSFRALPKLEKGGNQLIGWRLSAGPQQIEYPGGDHKLDWPWGELMLIDLTWAVQSPWRPSAASHSDAMQVRGATASFAGLGSWGLLRWIGDHHPTTAPAEDALDPRRNVLEFDVPLADASGHKGAAQLYLTTTVSAVDSKGQAGEPLTLPRDWPRIAPMHW